MKTINFYIMDTSSLIELNRRYPIDVFPSLWKNVEELINKGMLISHREVLKEISVKDDALKKWAVKQKNLFRDTDEKQAAIVKEILKKYPSLINSDGELSGADPFIIALAVSLDDGKQKTLVPTSKSKIIVTEEKLRGAKIRIPYVSKEYSIDCINMIEMCRAEGWKF
ncbi:MAG: DUF4411 family protein [archaeon]